MTMKEKVVGGGKRLLKRNVAYIRKNSDELLNNKYKYVSNLNWKYYLFIQF